MIVAVIALIIALGGTSYAALSLPANSVGTKQVKNRAITLAKIANTARTALKGAQGPAGPGALSFFVDGNKAFLGEELARVGPWTIAGSCTAKAGTTTMSVNALGPAGSVVDGEEDGHAYSSSGTNPALIDQLSLPSAYGFHEAQLDLHSPTGASAHVSLFAYAQSPSATFRCKINGSTFPTEAWHGIQG
jgi:hypothetical protein